MIIEIEQMEDTIENPVGGEIVTIGYNLEDFHFVNNAFSISTTKLIITSVKIKFTAPITVTYYYFYVFVL